jgi:predicted amidohydrolase YtcJ
MLEPYSDRSSTTGSLLVNASTLETLTLQWSQAGYQVNIHAIGDLANRLAINSFSKAYHTICPGLDGQTCQKQRRFRIEHSQIIHPSDQNRMFSLGIIPSIQPTHATSDMAYAESRLGLSRTKTSAYRMRSFLPLQPALGSDFPVEPANPFEGIFAAVTRKSPKTGQGKDGAKEGWYSDETLTLEQALQGFTTGPAHASFLERRAGVIQEGAFADWVVLDERLENLELDDLRKVRVRETWVAGRCVYRREGQGEALVKEELK